MNTKNVCIYRVIYRVYNTLFDTVYCQKVSYGPYTGWIRQNSARAVQVRKRADGSQELRAQGEENSGTWRSGVKIKDVSNLALRPFVADRVGVNLQVATVAGACQLDPR